jgi:sec-independent protein translocase protein TatA
MFPTLGMGELLLVLALVLLLFGPGKLPQVAQSLGEAVNRFRNGTKKIDTPAPALPTDAVETPKEDKPPTV